MEPSLRESIWRKLLGRKSSKRTKPTLALLAFAVLLALINSFNQYQLTHAEGQDVDLPELHSQDGALGTDVLFAEAFRNHQSDIQLSGVGKIKAILPIDNNGIRHQKFLVELEIGQVILIAHNIDVSSRIEKLRQGEEIEFYGEYIWNEKGGVIHWTHHDPKGRHPDGWIKYQGRVYR